MVKRPVQAELVPHVLITEALLTVATLTVRHSCECDSSKSDHSLLRQGTILI